MPPDVLHSRVQQHVDDGSLGTYGSVSSPRFPQLWKTLWKSKLGTAFRLKQPMSSWFSWGETKEEPATARLYG
jgi:hypothetical protein